MSARTRTGKKLPKRSTCDAWAESWQQHWSKVGMPGCELPASEENDFLTHARTPRTEGARLKRINDEFNRGFKGAFHVGRAVTVFGSARFKASHPDAKLACATDANLAKAGVEITP